MRAECCGTRTAPASTRPAKPIEIELPGLRLQSENWWRRAHSGWVLKRQRDREKNAVRFAFLAARAAVNSASVPPFLVTLTRRSPSTRGLDSDGLQGAFKYVRDEICRCLSVDDGDLERVAFVYRQERGPWGAHCRVEGRLPVRVVPCYEPPR